MGVFNKKVVAETNNNNEKEISHSPNDTPAETPIGTNVSLFT